MINLKYFVTQTISQEIIWLSEAGQQIIINLMLRRIKMMKAMTGYGHASYFGFCKTAISCDKSRRMEDWEYCKRITSQLKNNNINEALSHLFQSYFEGQILDIQIYNQIYEKISELAMPLSYAEILYLVYREHFLPNSLIYNWMFKLTYSKNEALLQGLKKDYDTINQPYPNRASRVKREPKKDQKQEKQQNSKEEVQTPKRMRQSKKSETHNTQSIQLPKIELPKEVDLSNLGPEQLIKLKFASELKEILEQLNVSAYSRVVMEDVQIEMNNQQAEDLEQDEEYDYGDEAENDGLGFFGLDIHKIKIGRIEFYNDKENGNTT